MSKLQQIDGHPIHDATKPIHIHIAPRDIQSAQRRAPAACAAAKCCTRTLPEIYKARVHLSCAYLFDGAIWHRYRTSRALRTELVAFDRGAKFLPGVYVLNAVPPSARRRARSGSKTNKNRPGKGARPLIIHHVEGVRPRGGNA